METHDLYELLQDADAQWMPRGNRQSIDTRRIVARARQRRNRQRMATGCAMAAILVVSGIVTWRLPVEQPSLVESVESEVVQLELKRLARQAELHTAVAEGLVQRIKLEELNERLEILRREQQELASIDLWEQELSRTAAISWQRAEFLRHELEDLDAARQQYRDVAERFPETHWAQLAGISLQQLRRDNSRTRNM